LPERPQILATVQSQRALATGSRVGLHLAVTGGKVAEPLRDFVHTPEAELHRYTVSVPADASLQPLHFKLMIGFEETLIAQVEFSIPIVNE
jgi:hypothetical protein